MQVLNRIEKPLASMLFCKLGLACVLFGVSAFRQATGAKITVLNSCRFPISAAHTADALKPNPGYVEGCQQVSSGSKVVFINIAKLEGGRWEAGKIWATRQNWYVISDID